MRNKELNNEKYSLLGINTKEKKQSKETERLKEADILDDVAREGLTQKGDISVQLEVGDCCKFPRRVPGT